MASEPTLDETQPSTDVTVPQEDTLENNLARLLQYKNAIKQSLLNKGAIAQDTPLSGYADGIDNMSGGEGVNSKDVIENGVDVLSGYNNATKIAKYAFIEAGISEANFPLCKNIGTAAFQSCSNLTVASFPLCENTDVYVFQFCRNLTNAYFPLLSRVSASVFYSCIKLTSVELGNCKSVGSYAFQNCSSLTSINLEKCEIIDNGGFSGCEKLTGIDLPKCSLISNGAFNKCYKLENVNIPKASRINPSAFQYCSVLPTVSVYNISIVQPNTFANCSKLMSLYMYTGFRCSLSNINAFASSPMSNSTYTGAFGSIYVPSETYDWYLTAPNWSQYSSRFVSMPNTDVFLQAYNITDYYTKTTETIWSSSFSKNQSISAVSGDVFTTAYSAFQGCYRLNDISLPQCTSIGQRCFESAGSYISISHVYLPNVEYIMNYGFEHAYFAENITIDLPKCSFIGTSAFTWCDTTGKNIRFSLPSLETIGSYAFYYGPQVSTLSLPSLKMISNHGFNCCYSLFSLYLLGSSVATLNNYNAFVGTTFSNYGESRGSIFVRASLLSQWKTKTNWIYYSNRFVGLTDEEIAAL